MSWICCPCRCRRRVKNKAVHTISATIRCNGVEPASKNLNLSDGRYKEPVSDLAEQAFKHLEFVEEERKRGSHVFEQSWSGSDQGTDHPDNGIPEPSEHNKSECKNNHFKDSKRSHLEIEDQPKTREIFTQDQNLEISTQNTQTELPMEHQESQTKESSDIQKIPIVEKVETTTSTENSTTQEIETQVEAKQFHEQSCQSEELPIVEDKKLPNEQETNATDLNELALQQFADLHTSLLNWLEETEELVENQKPPSSDYKVVRAQLQNHDFQTKLVDDKQESVNKFISLAESLLKSSDVDEGQRQNIRMAADEVGGRFSALNDDVHMRRQVLLDAQELANEFHKLQGPLTIWLEEASQQVTALCKVVTSREEIEANIEKQEVLKRQIDSKRENFDMMADCYSQLIKLVGAEDANELDVIVRNLSTKYDELGKRCVQCGHALHGFSEDMSSFLADTDELAEWLDHIEKEFERLGDLPLDGQELVALSEEFAELATCISERSSSVSRIVDESREICTHTSGGEALAMSSRIDRLHSRYNELLNASMQRIEVFATAIRVSDELVDMVEQLEDFMDACDDAINTLDESSIDDQIECVAGLDEELQKNSSLIDEVEEMSHQLRSLSNKSDQQDVELIRRSEELRHRFLAARALVEERGRRLQMADSQARTTFDALDFWLEFFEDALEQSARGDRPPADLEQLKDLMHKQRTLNERVAAERAGVRDLVTEAARVARDINSNLGAEDPQMDAKIERVRKLVEDTAEAGAERMAVLEQVHELCKELVPAYEELNDGMHKLESEFQKCRPINTGQSPEELKEQLSHNNQMLQLVRSEKQNLHKFSENIDAVVELCAKEDAAHLRKLCEQLRERHSEIASAFGGRGEALERTIADSSAFEDRFAAFLASLESAAVITRQLDAISSRPPILRRQLDENTRSIQLWEQKAAFFEAMRSSAMDLIAQSKHNDSQILDVSQKIAMLDELWLEIRSSYDARDRQLRLTIPLAERFWTTSTDTQSLFKALRSELSSLPEGGVEPSSLDLQKQLLDKVKNQLNTATPHFEALHKTAAELLLNVGDESERSFVEQQLQLLDQEWQMLSQTYAHRASRLGMAHDKSTQYFLACNSLDQFLQQMDSQLQQTGEIAPGNAPAIRVAIDQLQVLRQTLNARSLERDDLNRAANEMCVNSQPQQIAAIRGPFHTINDRFNRLYALIGEKQHRLERSLLDLGQFEQVGVQLHSWIVGTEKALDIIQQNASTLNDSDVKQIEVELAKFGVLKRDISAHVPSFEAFEKAATMLIQCEDPTAPAISEICSQLITRWNAMQARADQLHSHLEQQHASASSRTSQLDKWSMWLSDVLAQLSITKLVGALPETVATQIADLRLLQDEVEHKRPALERDLQESQRQLANAEGNEEKAWLKERLNPVEHQWKQVNERLAARESQLKKAEEEALDLAKKMEDMSEWVEKAEQALTEAAPISRISNEIQKQLEEHSLFVEMTQTERTKMAALSNRGLKVQMTCEKKDAIPIKNQLVSLKNRNERIAQRAIERAKQIQSALKEAEEFEKNSNELRTFTSKTLMQLSEAETQSAETGERIRDQLDAHRLLETEVIAIQPLFEDTYAAGRSLIEKAPNGEKKELSKRNEELKTEWVKLEEKANKRKQILDDALVQSGKFDEALNQLLSWLGQKLPSIEEELKVGNMKGDVDTLQVLIKENDKLSQELKSRQSALATIRKRAENILSDSTNSEDADQTEVREKTDRLNDEWQRLENAVEKKAHLLNDCLVDGVELTESSHELREQLNDFELRLRRDLQSATDQTDAAKTLVDIAEKMSQEFKVLEQSKEKLESLASSTLQKAHPRAITPIKDLMRSTNAHWDQVRALLDEKVTTTNELHSQLTKHDEDLKKMNAFTTEQQKVLQDRNSQCEQTWTLPAIQELVLEHAEFKEHLRAKDPLMESIMKLVRRSAVTTPDADESRASTPNLSKSMTSISGTLPRKSNAQKSRLLPEKQVLTRRQRRSEQLNDQWNQLWTDTVSTEDRLKERKADIEELRRLESFTFAEWRERYLAWNDSAKARISDLFRRIDKHGAGFVPRQQFIDGVLSSKFPTTKLEMEKVANEFDKNGQIASKEFMNALRYEGRNRRLLQNQQQNQNKTDPERIHNEIKRETERCQCAHPFKINRDNSTSTTGTVRYAFGESSIKRMVRILHSTVMVRVGGGWVELASFLMKHDPCRAKGRTNLELLQGHEFMPSLTPSGAVDQMTTFQRKPSSSSAEALRQQQNAQLIETYKQGPIIKIREKTERSIPMFKKPMSVASSRSGSATRVYSRQSSDVSIKVDGSRIPRPCSSNNLAASRPSSRASDVSERSMSIVTPSRIPSIRGRKGAPQVSSARQSPMPR